jgi:hypothetical protein
LFKGHLLYASVAAEQLVHFRLVRLVKDVKFVKSFMLMDSMMQC